MTRPAPGRTSARPGRVRAAPWRSARRAAGGAGFVRRHRRGIGVLAAAGTGALVFLAGMGTATVLVMDRLGAMAAGPAPGGAPRAPLPGAPDTGPGAPRPPGAPPAPAPTPAPGGGGTDLDAWAAGQGLPGGLPEQVLRTLYERYPGGVPEETRDQLEERFGG